MTEHHADEQPRKGNTAPGMEGEGGQYVSGDYGDAGTGGAPTENLEDGEYQDGDYGAAGTSGRAREADVIGEELTDEQANTTAEEGRPDGDR